MQASQGAGSRRVAAIVEYDGTEYAGWQSQDHAASIQDAVQAALSFVAGEPVTAICAGRTDSGVHAAGQVIHFDTGAIRTPRAWVLGTNTRLAPSIALQWAGEVTLGFHARHKAIRRIYRYCILNRSARSALQRTRAAWIHRPLDAAAMHTAVMHTAVMRAAASHEANLPMRARAARGITSLPARRAPPRDSWRCARSTRP